MEVKEITFKSTSGICDIWGRRCINAGNTKPLGIIQLMHGMCEHSYRYDEFIQILCDQGYVVYMHDHLGHGKSVKCREDLGYMGKSHGMEHLVDDVYEMTKIAKADYPDLKHVVFGHSMGSFVCRLYTAKYGKEVDGAIYCGTSGKNPAASIALGIAKTLKKTKGDHYRSHLITALAFGMYNKRFDGETNSDWLSRDMNKVYEYIDDKYCGFCFTTSGYIELFRMVLQIAKSQWYTAVPADLPILLMAGDQDPVGNYGKGVREVYYKLRETGHKNVTLHMYKDCRHEVLNELNKDEVIKQTLDWIASVIA